MDAKPDLSECWSSVCVRSHVVRPTTSFNLILLSFKQFICRLNKVLFLTYLVIKMLNPEFSCHHLNIYSCLYFIFGLYFFIKLCHSKDMGAFICTNFNPRKKLYICMPIVNKKNIRSKHLYKINHLSS